MPALFAATLFVSATLLFMVQPMVGKMILPLLGGSPAAWNTCMVFFQSLVLAGYLYAHTLTTRVPVARQVFVHRAVLGVAVAWLLGSALLSPAHSPIAVFRTLAPQGQSNPVPGVLGLLGIAIGLPFLVLSTSAPLLQRWFSETRHPSSSDPYFLYAASNAGSLISLLGYPLVIEPRLTLVEQAWLWAGGYLVLLVLIRQCSRATAHPYPGALAAPRPAAGGGTPVATPEGMREITAAVENVADPTPLSIWRKLRWLGLAFVPSSLMLGVTFHLTTDVASVPMLWVIPLALYLTTFIIAYLRTPPWFRPALVSIGPVFVLLLVFVLTSHVLSGQGNAFAVNMVHLVTYFVVALLMHTELAHLRPNPRRLTEYYLWISAGGVLGGIFNAMVAPAIFNANFEYPLTLAAACLLIPALDSGARRGLLDRAFGKNAGAANLALDFAYPAFVGLLTWALCTKVVQSVQFAEGCDAVADFVNRTLTSAGLKPVVAGSKVLLLAVYAVPCMLCFVAIDRPIRFGLCVAAILGIHTLREWNNEEALWRARSPFGILHIEEDVPRAAAPVPFYRLLHGTTLHGTQASATYIDPVYDHFQLVGCASPWQTLGLHGCLESWDARQEPLTYYHRTGPVGDMVRQAELISPGGAIGMVGLGTGSAAAYAKPGQAMTFYEIDRVVVDLVESGKYFTYVQAARARGADVEIVLGDARLQLERSDKKFSLLLIDAFSSDSIPVHLLTREAIALYKSHLTEHGILALHISNRYLNLEPVVAALAEDAGLVCQLGQTNDSRRFPGKTAASWVVLAQRPEDIEPFAYAPDTDTALGGVAGGYAYLVYNHPWSGMSTDPAVRVWTDDFSDVLRVVTVPEFRWILRRFGVPLPKAGNGS